MSSNKSFTVVAVVLDGQKAVSYVCATDGGTILEYPVEGKQGMLSLLKWHPDYVRNLTLRQALDNDIAFPVEVGNSVAGTVICAGLVNNQKLYRVVSKQDGIWVVNDVDAEQLILRIRTGAIVNAELLGQKVVCKVPLRPEVFNVVESVKQEENVNKPIMEKQVSINLLYITEASDENGNILRYAGVEFVGKDEEKMRLLKERLLAHSYALREDYYQKFDRKDAELAVQAVKDRFFIVLPYDIVKSFLESGTQTINITRVLVSAVAFRGGCIFDEAKVAISGSMGCGEIRCCNGACNDAIRKLIVDVQSVFKTYIQLHVKRRRKKTQD